VAAGAALPYRCVVTMPLGGQRPRRPTGGNGGVYQITGARRGVSEDVGSRAKRYVISMAIRTVCFPLAVLTEGWLRWTFVAGALLLPYFAVIIANAGRENPPPLPNAAMPSDQRALGPGGSAGGGTDRAAGAPDLPPNGPVDKSDRNVA
jgi:hypothetical protein